MGNRIKELREDHHMTQIRLSIELEVSQEIISAYEHEKHYPSVATLKRMSKILRASCDYILGLTDVRYPSLTNALSKEEQQILMQFRLMSNRQKEAALSSFHSILNQK